MRTLSLALCAVLCASCTSLSQADYDRLAAIPAEVKAVYDEAKSLTEEAKALVATSNERALTEAERIRVGILFERVNDLMAKGKGLASEADEIRERAASGAFDWEGLVYVLGSVLGALGVVRFQRGPAKPTDKNTADEIKHLDAATLAKLRQLAQKTEVA
jgi:hypothetical protein